LKRFAQRIAFDDMNCRHRSMARMHGERAARSREPNYPSARLKRGCEKLGRVWSFAYRQSTPAIEKVGQDLPWGKLAKQIVRLRRDLRVVVVKDGAVATVVLDSLGRNHLATEDTEITEEAIECCSR
jgi:hypothetical protein